MKHTIRTFNSSGKCMFEEHFSSTAKAYARYREIIDNAQSGCWPKGYEITVVRYNGNYTMAMETVIC